MWQILSACSAYCDFILDYLYGYVWKPNELRAEIQLRFFFFVFERLFISTGCVCLLCCQHIVFTFAIHSAIVDFVEFISIRSLFGNYSICIHCNRFLFYYFAIFCRFICIFALFLIYFTVKIMR